MAVSMDGTLFDEAGPANAPAVVLIHGLGLNRTLWQWLLPDLTDRYRVITYDLIGHGDSAAPQVPPTLTLLAGQLAGLLDHLRIDQAGIVGFSLGGMIARRFAQDHRDRTAALAILHSPHARARDAQAAVDARVRLAAAEGPQATVDAALERWFTDSYRAAHPQMMTRVRAWVCANDPAVYPLLYRVFAEGIDEIVAPNPPITCPALVLTGDQDHGNGPDMARAIAGEIANSELVILPGLRHMALVEDPATVNAPLATFLDRHLGDKR